VEFIFCAETRLVGSNTAVTEITNKVKINSFILLFFFHILLWHYNKIVKNNAILNSHKVT